MRGIMIKPRRIRLYSRSEVFADGLYRSGCGDSIRSHHSLNITLEIKRGVGHRKTSAAHPIAQLAIGRERQNALGDGFSVASFHDKPSLTVPY